MATEVLGFTTRAWKGGQSREAWLAEGRPAEPGRLNDLRVSQRSSQAAAKKRHRRHEGKQYGATKHRVNPNYHLKLSWG